MAEVLPVLPAQLYETSPGLLIKRWGGPSDVVFHTTQNSTHLIDAQAGRLLQTLQTAPASIESLCLGDDQVGLAAMLAALLQAGMVREASQ